MSTHTIDQAARRNARRLMNTAVLRMACVAGLSIVFALIHCTAPIDDGQGLTLPSTIDIPALAQASHAVAAPAAAALDHPLVSETVARPN